MLCGSGKLGMNLTQLIIAPTFAKKVNKDNSFGVSVLLAAQQFKAEGLSGFFNFTSSAAGGPPAYANNNLTDRGNDTTYGYGLKLGWMGKMSDTVTLGASYTSKVKMGKFTKYQDLFAGQGAFDMPESFELGIAFKASPKWTIAADYERINYSGVDSVGNPSRIRARCPAWRSGPPTGRHDEFTRLRQLPRLRLERCQCVQARRRIPVQPEADPARRL